MGKRRAAKGDGSVESLPSGKFRAVVSRTVNGKRVRGSKTFDRKADALAWKRTQLTKGPTGAGTLGEWLTAWLALHQVAVGRSHFLNDRQTAEKHVRPHLGPCRLRDLTPLRCRQFLAALADATTANERHKAGKLLRKLLNAAVENGELPSSPMSRVKLPPASDPQTDSLTAADLQLLIAAADRLGHGALFRLSADAGLRPGELLALQWHDWNPKEGEVSVRRAMDYASHELKEPKTRRSRRTLPVAPCTAAAIEAYRAGHATDASPMFPTTGGLHWWPSNFLDHVFNPVVTAAGISCTRYTLRHTMATLLLQSGVSIKVVSERLGHEDVATTLRAYVHVLPGMQKAAAMQMESILTPPPRHSPTSSQSTPVQKTQPPTLSGVASTPGET